MMNYDSGDEFWHVVKFSEYRDFLFMNYIFLNQFFNLYFE